jgi:hypothetical protein
MEEAKSPNIKSKPKANPATGFRAPPFPAIKQKQLLRI